MPATRSVTRRAGFSGEHRIAEKGNHSKSWAPATGPHPRDSETYVLSERPSNVAEQHAETDLSYRERSSDL
jgi:hypothetical protein